MVAYSFKAQFVDAIIIGRKMQTIRPNRSGMSRHARAGDPLQLYTAMRTKHCRFIGRAICVDARPIFIDFRGGEVSSGGLILANGLYSLNEFAKLDGFADWLGMSAFWAGEHPGVLEFSGTIIYWGMFAPAA